MRYNLESTLPINAFSPRGGRSPFNHGMTLEGGGGGGGILKPITSAIGSVAKGVTDVVKGVVQPVYNATLKQIPGVDNALVNLDKSVAKAIPGGWGTVASVAASFIPGAQLAAMGMTQTGLATGLGALTGSGVFKKGNQFNLQGAIMGGAMAYGASQLSQGLQEAGKVGTDATTKSIEEAAKEGTTSAAAQSIPTDVNAGLAGTTPTPPVSEISPNLMKAAQSNIDPSILEGMSAPEVASANVLNTPTPQPSGLESLTQAGKGTVSNMADVGTGIKNLAGFGAQEGTAAAARSAFMEPITQGGAVAGLMGFSGLAALEEQQKQLDAQLAAGNIAQDEYNAEKAKIDAQIATARQAVSEHPFSSEPDRSFTKQDTLYAGASPDETLYGRPSSDVSASKTLYNKGGEVQHFFGGGIPISPDMFDKIIAEAQATQQAQQAAQQAQQAAQQAAIQAPGIKAVAAAPWNTEPDRSVPAIGINLYSRGSAPVEIKRTSKSDDLLYAQHPEFTPRSFAVGGSIDDESGMDEARGLAQGNLQNGFLGGGIASFATGGMPPRFLSGGGDGMSDSIKASIGGTQEARLADGEFVIPADVVSHLGNGSSKAGAKQLYSMMDRVRQARVGTKKQGKQINPRKYMAA